MAKNRDLVAGLLLIELWAAVRKITGTSKARTFARHLLADPDLVNQFFANISTTDDYNDSDVLSLQLSGAHSMDGCHITAIEVELVLRHLKNTAPGIDSMGFP